MHAGFLTADHFLRGRGRFAPAHATARPWWLLPAMVVAFAPLYGAAMGSFSANAPERLAQVAFAAAKVPLLLFATTLICLPGFYALNTVLGLRDDFPAAMQAVLSGQAALGMALAAFSPLTLVWYASSDSYRAALLFNAAIFALSTMAGQLVMRREYRPLIARRRRHAAMLVAWVFMYAFVGVEMGWMLRPFVGDPNLPASFFRPEPFSNAYVVVVHLILGR